MASWLLRCWRMAAPPGCWCFQWVRSYHVESMQRRRRLVGAAGWCGDGVGEEAVGRREAWLVDCGSADVTVVVV